MSGGADNLNGNLWFYITGADTAGASLLLRTPQGYAFCWFCGRTQKEKGLAVWLTDSPSEGACGILPHNKPTVRQKTSSAIAIISQRHGVGAWTGCSFPLPVLIQADLTCLRTE